MKVIIRFILLYFLIIFYSSSIFSEEINVEVIKKSAKILPSPNVREVPLAEGKIGDLYEVLETHGEWYKVLVEIEDGFTIEGWINKKDAKVKTKSVPKKVVKTVPITKPKEEKKTKKDQKITKSEQSKPIDSEKDTYEEKGDDRLLFDSEEGKKNNEKLDISASTDNLKAPRGRIAIIAGTQKESFTIDELAEVETTINTGLPYSILAGLFFDYYFIKTKRNDLGFEMSYNYSKYNYTPVINDVASEEKIHSTLHSGLLNIKYRFSIIPGNKNFSLIPKVGVRYLNFKTDDITETTSGENKRLFYFVNSTYMALNASPCEIEYVLPLFGDSFDFGLRARWDLALLTKYSEDKSDINADTVEESVTGGSPKPATINSVIGGELFFIFFKSFFVETGMEMTKLKVTFSGDGYRAGENIKDGTMKENYTTYKFLVGYRF